MHPAVFYLHNPDKHRRRFPQTGKQRIWVKSLFIQQKVSQHTADTTWHIQWTCLQFLKWKKEREQPAGFICDSGDTLVKPVNPSARIRIIIIRPAASAPADTCFNFHYSASDESRVVCLWVIIYWGIIHGADTQLHKNTEWYFMFLWHLAAQVVYARPPVISGLVCCIFFFFAWCCL